MFGIVATVKEESPMTSRILIIATALLAVAFSANAAAQATLTTRTVELFDCSHEGGEATIGFNGNQVETWSLTVYGSNYVTNVRTTRRAADDVLALHFRQTFHDHSEISYQLDVRPRDGAWDPASQLAMYYGERIREDLEGIAATYEMTVGAARAGRSELTCTAEDRVGRRSSRPRP